MYIAQNLKNHKMKQKINVAIIAFVVLFMACDKIPTNEPISTTEAQTLLTEAATAYSIYAKTQNEGTKVAFEMDTRLKSGSLKSTEFPQVDITPENLTDWPKTITVNYGSENHLGWDGRYRRGTMIITASNWPNIENAQWDITFSDFYQNDHKIEGIQSIKYTGSNADGNPEYECHVTDGVVTTPNEKVFTFEQDTKREWIAGSDTHYVLTKDKNDFCDDEFLISGWHGGKSSDGYAYTMTSDSDPLHVNVCCPWVLDGKLTISIPNNDLSCTIDYRPDAETGDMCNGKVVFSIFGVDFPITLE